MILNEKLGVSAFRYNKQIKEIVNYVDNYIKDKDSTDLTIIIPEKLTNDIDMFNNLKLIVNVSNNYDGDYKSGTGKSLFANDVILNDDNKIENAKITINAYSYNNILYKRTLTHSLYHELNHYYEYYKRLLRNEDPFIFIGKQITNYEYKQLNFSSNDIDKYIKTVLYRLYIKTEYNALISSVYPDLIEYGTTKNNLQYDLSYTTAYSIYKYIKNNTDILNSLTVNDWEILYEFCNDTTNNGYGDYYLRTNSILGFKRKFIKTLNYKLNNFYKDIRISTKGCVFFLRKKRLSL